VKKTFSVSRPSSALFPAGLVLALFGFGLYFDQVSATMPQPEAVAQLRADLARERAAPEVQQVAQWAVVSQDPGGLPFVVVDQAQARVFTFDSQGKLQRSAPIEHLGEVAEQPSVTYVLPEAASTRSAS
jgi:hypothetical protein